MRKGSKAYAILFPEPFSPVYCHVPKGLPGICIKLHEPTSWNELYSSLIRFISANYKFEQKTISYPFTLSANLNQTSTIDWALC